MVETDMDPSICEHELSIPVLRNKEMAWLSAGSEHALAISSSGLVNSWGRDHHGQLRVMGMPTIILVINCGQPRTCGLTSNRRS